MTSDDVGQQRLQAAEQRLAPTGGQMASAPRVCTAGRQCDRGACGRQCQEWQTPVGCYEQPSGRRLVFEDVQSGGDGPSDGGSLEMAAILMSLGVAPANPSCSARTGSARIGGACARDEGWHVPNPVDREVQRWQVCRG